MATCKPTSSRVPIGGIILRCAQLLILLPLFFLVSCQMSGHRLPPTQNSYVIDNKRYYPIPSAEGYSESGVASWYGGKFHGRKTSCGEVYDMFSMTAAHKTLPMNTMVLVRNLENGKETVVRVNDRGPFVSGRIIDLSFKAAQELGLADKGVAKVQVTALGEEEIRQLAEAPSLVYEDLSAGEFYVQVGSFAENRNAAKLQKRFIDAGFPAIIEKDVETEQPSYRVQVYAGKTLAKAKRAESSLLQRGYTDVFVIAR